MNELAEIDPKLSNKSNNKKDSKLVIKTFLSLIGIFTFGFLLYSLSIVKLSLLDELFFSEGLPVIQPENNTFKEVPKNSEEKPNFILPESEVWKAIDMENDELEVSEQAHSKEKSIEKTSPEQNLKDTYESKKNDNIIKKSSDLTEKNLKRGIDLKSLDLTNDVKVKIGNKEDSKVINNTNDKVSKKDIYREDLNINKNILNSTIDRTNESVSKKKDIEFQKKIIKLANSELNKNLSPKNIRVQLASFPLEQSAKKEWQRLNKKHSKIFEKFEYRISKVSLTNNKTFYRLQIGPINNYTQANDLCLELKSLDVNCIIINSK